MNFWLPQATRGAVEVDLLIVSLIVASCLVLGLVFGLILLYGVRYRAGSAIDRGAVGEKSWRFEMAWTAATLVCFLALFVWGADLYVRLFQPPSDALQISVVAKQWMWKVEHQNGRREINMLHTPTGRPVQLLMTSEDVIHDFSVPAFRIKRDVLPGRYETLWFEATQPGVYNLFCTQLCGQGHAAMIGKVVALAPDDFQKWLESGEPSDQPQASAGAELYARHGCAGCHGSQGEGRGVGAPALANLFGATVTLADGRRLVADDDYLRGAILTPQRLRIARYPPLMPAYAGQLTEEETLRLIGYIKTLQRKGDP